MESNKPLGYLLGRSNQVFKSQMVTEFREKEIDMTFEQFLILHLLNSNCDFILRDLAIHLQKDKSIIVRQINCLLENQYVVRLTNKNDKRIKNLILTKKGFDILNCVRKIADEVSEKLLTGISDADLEIFRNVLGKIHENGGIEEDFFNCGLNQQK